jgi:hypothetical protein
MTADVAWPLDGLLLDYGANTALRPAKSCFEAAGVFEKTALFRPLQGYEALLYAPPSEHPVSPIPR